VNGIMRVVGRFGRVAHRLVTIGQLTSSPKPIIKRTFGAGPVTFVQIGSNDGLLGDPLHELIKSNPLWRGVFIEPVDYVFNRLVQNYGKSERFAFEKIAIAERPGERAFYFVSEDAFTDPSIPPLADKLGSFMRSHIVKHSPALEKYIVTTKVRCDTLSAVLARHNLSTIDLVHTDTEGYDFHILQQIDFQKYRPKIILFEHAHMTPAEYRESKDLLQRFGYRLTNCGLDTVAIAAKRAM
jgi:FkbM family methyltransferase